VDGLEAGRVSRIIRETLNAATDKGADYYTACDLAAIAVLEAMTPDPNGAHNIDYQDLEPPDRTFQLVIVIVTLALIGAFFVFA
jgi:hypothetical protein